MGHLFETDCIFCQIAAGKIPTEKLFESDKVLAFPDINPISPFHALVIPKDHYENLLELPAELMMDIHQAIDALARTHGFVEAGFRVVNNVGRDGGQEVPHVHFHVLAGRAHKWPPG